ncbi:MAG: AMP-binding protein [Acetobacteraceae bacterium]|nr:AMP-binding protein [Acetobacteraceae bacterium]
MDEHYDQLEVRTPEARQEAEARNLVRQIAHAKANSPYYQALLSSVDPAAIDSRAALAQLPVTRKSELKDIQARRYPFGGLNGWDIGKVAHIYQSPGPIYEPDSDGVDYWRFARSLWAAGVRPGMIVHNTFSYHLTPAGMIIESGARVIGCPVIPAGVGNTELQVQAIADIRPEVYCGTPSFLKILLEKGRESGADTASLKLALVGGEALPPSLRKEINQLGVFVLQSYGTADLGLIAYESRAMEGLIIDEGALVEIVRPGTGEPLPDGEVGEVVVTIFNPVYPLIRFATGDLSAVMVGASPCGRTNMRIKGWMGRADQTTKVKGMFVHPSQIAQVTARHPEILKARLEVESHDNLDEMTLRCEVNIADEALAAAVGATLQSVCKLRGRVTLARPGELPNDGKVIADLRSYR